MPVSIQNKSILGDALESIDVAVLTMNSERMLRECLTSIYNNVPVNNLIIVDGCSIDHTVEIVRDFQQKYGNVTFIREKGTRGGARQTAIELIKTDWFLFVDSDVILSKNWYREAKKLVKDDVGAIWGIEVWSVLRKSKLLKMFERVTLKIFEKRGGTHDLLVRRKAVEGIKIPSICILTRINLLKTGLKKRGYKVIGVYEPYCTHFRSDQIWTVSKHMEFIVSDLKHAVHRPALLLSYGFYTAIAIYQILLHKFRPPSPLDKTS